MQTYTVRSPGTLYLLGILFVGLKLTGLLSWSWWWVLLPFYAFPLFLVAVFVGVLFAAALGGTGKRRARRKKLSLR